MKKLILFLILFLAVLSSCVTQRPASIERDTLYVETLREIPILIPGDSVLVEVPIDCPDQNLAVFENARLRQLIRIKDRKLQSFTNIKPDTVIVTVTDTKTVIKEVIVTKPVEFIPKRFKVYRNIAFAIFALAFGFMGWKAFKFFRPKI